MSSKCMAMIVSALCWGADATIAAAQVGSTAQITGTVRDESGGVLPGVDVTATQTATGFTPTPVKVVRRTESRVVVEGLAADAEVALTNPERHAGGRAARSAAAPAMQGGG